MLLKIKGNLPYTFRKVIDGDIKPLNHYLLDADVAKCLKKIYKTSTKKDLMESEEIMEDFFGTLEWGQFFLTSLTDEQWDQLNELDE